MIPDGPAKCSRLLNDTCPKRSTSASVFNLTRTRRPGARDHDHALSANRCTDGPHCREPTAFALRQRFHPLIVAATVNAHPHQASPEDTAQAIDEAVAAIDQAIQEKTDPLTLFLKEALKETSPGKDTTP